MSNELSEVFLVSKVNSEEEQILQIFANLEDALNYCLRMQKDEHIKKLTETHDWKDAEEILIDYRGTITTTSYDFNKGFSLALDNNETLTVRKMSVRL